MNYFSADLDHLDDLIIVGGAIMQLTDKERVVVALRLSGYTQKECGEIIGMTRAAAAAIYKRGVDHLAKSIRRGNDNAQMSSRVRSNHHETICYMQ